MKKPNRWARERADLAGVGLPRLSRDKLAEDTGKAFNEGKRARPSLSLASVYVDRRQAKQGLYTLAADGGGEAR